MILKKHLNLFIFGLIIFGISSQELTAKPNPDEISSIIKKLKHSAIEKNSLEPFEKFGKNASKIAIIGKILGGLSSIIPILFSTAAIYQIPNPLKGYISDDNFLTYKLSFSLILNVFIEHFCCELGKEFIFYGSFKSQLKNLFKNWDKRYKTKVPKEMVNYINEIHAKWINLSKSEKNILYNRIIKMTNTLTYKKRSLFAKTFCKSIENLTIALLAFAFLYVSATTIESLS